MALQTAKDIVFTSILQVQKADSVRQSISLGADLRRDLLLSNLDITMVSYKVEEMAFNLLSCVIQIGGSRVSSWVTVQDIVETADELIASDLQENGSQLDG